MTEIGDNSQIDIDHDEIRSYLDDLSGKQKNISEATSALRNKLKEVLNDTGWHKGALATIRKIDAMSPTARADYLRSLVPMLAVLRENKWDAEAEDLFNEDAD